MDKFSTFYLKYRPQRIAELDLKLIREQLKKILASKTMAHAFLFSGPRGLGKTSAARIVAKTVNCLKKGKKTSEPCNKCSVCRSITDGNCLDLIEIDAASNRGIDDIRELREKVKLSPSQARKKVYVIDEVHMLTPEAFNALLKTLEEPPRHVLFILCTTEPHKLPETIISRCQHLKFRKATNEEIVRSLTRIKKGEKLNIKDEILEKISQQADGSFRDAAKSLEMMVAIYGKRIGLKQLKEFFSKEIVSVRELLAFLAQKDRIMALKWLDEAVKNGLDLKNLTQQILESLRKILLSKYQILDEKIADYNFSLEEIKRLIFLFDQGGRNLKEAVLPQLALELAILEWIDDNSNNGSKPNKPQVSISFTKKKDKSLDFVLENWPQVLEKTKSFNHSVEALLKAARPISIKKGNLIIEVFYPFHKEKLEEKNCLKLVEEKLKEVAGLALKIKYILSPKKGGDKSV